MAQEFYTIITKIGQEKLVSATTGQKLEFYQFAVGDGNGRYYEPTVSQYALVNEKYRANTNATTIEENRITIECLIPAHIGGFTIREIGIFDKQGSLVLVGKYPQTEKPVDSFGGLKDLYIKVQLEVDNPETIAMTVDPNVVIVTKQNLNQELSNYLKKNETVNDLDSSDKDRPLSAAQGKRLNENKLGITEKAADSDKLDGQDSTYFATSQKAGSLETQIEQLRADIQNLTQQLNNKADKNMITAIHLPSVTQAWITNAGMIETQVIFGRTEKVMQNIDGIPIYGQNGQTVQVSVGMHALMYSKTDQRFYLIF